MSKRAVLFALAVLAMASTSLAQAAVKSVVLVHGAFADGSGAATLLSKRRYTSPTIRPT